MPADSLTVIEQRLSDRDVANTEQKRPDRRRGGRRCCPTAEATRADRRRQHHRPAGRACCPATATLTVVHPRGPDRRPAGRPPQRRAAPAARPGPPHHPGRRRARRRSQALALIRADIAFVGHQRHHPRPRALDARPDRGRHQAGDRRRAPSTSCVLADSSKIGLERTIRFADARATSTSWSPTTGSPSPTVEAGSSPPDWRSSSHDRHPYPQPEHRPHRRPSRARWRAAPCSASWRVTQQAGGKGVNISRAAVSAGLATIAVLPGRPGRPVRPRAGRGRHPLPSRVRRPARSGSTSPSPSPTAPPPSSTAPAPPSRGVARRAGAGAARPAADSASLGGAGRVAAPRRPRRLVRRAWSTAAPYPGVRLAVDTSEEPLAALVAGCPAPHPT